MIGFTAQRLMELEVEGLTGAAPVERGPDRINQRNGYADKAYDAEDRRGWVVLGTAGRLVGHFYIHNGDDSGFVCDRA